MFHILMINTVDSAGGVHTDVHYNGADIKAVDETTGTLYEFIYVSGQTNITSASGTTVWTSAFTFDLISHGTVPNSEVHFEFHFTNNPEERRRRISITTR
jgi:hypothetical protein